MSEFWVPQPNKHPDVSNLYDMMVVFQEQLDLTPGREAKIHLAKLALRALASSLDSLTDEERQVSVVTGLAFIHSTEHDKQGAMVENVGLSGLIEDVHCVHMGETLPMAVSLGLDVVSIFPPDSPEDNDLILSIAKAPINSVRYIETIAS